MEFCYAQIFATSFLVICILGISDRRNMGPPPGLMPFSLGLIVVATNMTLALNCGNAMNPARDLPPRIFTAMAGWGVEPFR
jgi:glycerol uptake facilitator-like aquaporin